MVSECKIVSAVDFQRQSEELGSNIKVISTDPSIDDGDSFFIPQPDGSSRVLDRGDPRIQAVIARVQSDCTNKLGKRNRKEALRQDIERAFGVKLKPHKMFRCPCEEFMVFKGTQPPFHIHTGQDTGGLEGHNGGAEFTPRHLVSLLADKLKVPVPEQFRVKLTITPEDRQALAQIGVRIVDAEERLEMPKESKIDFSYGGSLRSGGFNEEVEIKYVGNGRLLIIYREEGRENFASATLDIYTGELF